MSGTGNSGLLKVGAGVFELAGTNTFGSATSLTTVQGGELKVTGELGLSAITVESSGKLTGDGLAGSGVTVRSGGVLSPSGPFVIKGALRIDLGATVEFDLMNNGNSRLDDEISGVTDLVLNGTLVTRVNGDLSNREWGSWRLIQHTGTISGAGLTIDASTDGFPTLKTGYGFALASVVTNTSDKTLQLRCRLHAGQHMPCVLHNVRASINHSRVGRLKA
jgi:fibronectin-binding autotransporter adhesin